MLMKKDGSTIGTVGGGLLEAETEKLCRKTFETKKKTHIYDFTLDFLFVGVFFGNDVALAQMLFSRR